MSNNFPSFETAMRILPKLLNGVPPKVIAADEGVSYTTISKVKEMFPLFLGLPRAYKARTED